MISQAGVSLKKMVVLSCSLFLFFAATAQEQKTGYEGSVTPKFGVKGGLNFSNLFVDDVKDENIKTGINVGLYAKIPLATGFSIQPELLYSTKGAKLSYSNVLLGSGEYRFNLNYVELPVLAVVNVAKNLNLQAGAYVSYLATASVTRLNSASGSVDKIKDLKTDDFNRFDYGLAGGLGLDVQNFTIGARYNYGLQEIGKGNASVAGQATKNSKNSVIAVFIGIGI